jgi:polysaccharide pyruvyl transferase CsaB
LKNIFVFGYYGFDNAGDEIIIKEIVDSFKKPGIEFFVLTYNFKRTKERLGENPVSRDKYLDIIKSIKKSDLVIGGGGSLIQDVTSSKSLYYYLGLIALSKIFGKKVLFLFSGFGPVTGSFNKSLTKFILNKVDYIVLRDEMSEKFLEDLGIKVPYITAGDAAFLANDIGSKQRVSENNNEKIVGISLRRWCADDLVINEMKKTIDFLLEKGYRVKLIPMKFPDDYEFIKKLDILDKKEVSIVDNYLEFDSLCGEIEECRFLIGMRLHSLILSALVNKPMVGISYDPKIDGFLNSVNQINHGPVESISFQKMKKDIELLEENYEEYKKKLVQSTREMKKINSEVVEDIKNRFIN